MTPRHLPRIARLSLAVGLLLAAGCISIPDAVRADLEPPDGRRPNNFGKRVETPAGAVVRPDTPTIGPAEGL